jgi:hypothetical protein
LHQEQEQIEFLGRQQDDFAIAIQTVLTGSEPERAELVKLTVLQLQMSHKPSLADLYIGLY